VTQVTTFPGTKNCRVVVPDDQLSLAIGKEGQNARLAARLTGYKIDIKSQTAAAELEAQEALEAELEAQEAEDEALLTETELEDETVPVQEPEAQSDAEDIVTIED
jgi:N utilization substance protein A